MPTFKTKTGKVVSFRSKSEGKMKPLKVKFRSKLKKPSRKDVFSVGRVLSQSRARPRTRSNQMAKKRRSRSRGSSSGGLTQALLGGAVAGFIGSMVPFGNYGKVGAALLGHKQGGMIGSTAKALGVIGAANLVQGVGLNMSTATQTVAGDF
jgi:hypothetical protein